MPKTGERVPKVWFLAFFGYFWQDFWHYELSFWQITDVRNSGKPIKWAFVGDFRNAKNFKFGRKEYVFGRLHL